MIREGKKLPSEAVERIPELIHLISEDKDVIALFSFGSLVSGDLKPLSDLDFAVLVSPDFDRNCRFDKHIDLIGLFTRIFGSDEIDLVFMNDAPMRFAYYIIKSGKLLFCSNKNILNDFAEKTVKLFLDFRYFRDEFDHEFLKGIGYCG